MIPANAYDPRATSVPAFPGLTRFGCICSTEFADGKKFFSILQQILPLIVDFIPPTMHPLLKLIRILAHISLYVNHKAFTDQRLRELSQLIASFGETLTKSVAPKFLDKSWTFPKLHQLTHLEDDIKQKGSPYWFSTILGESFHQGLIQLYQASNKKNVTQQIVNNEASVMFLSRIRRRLNLLKVCGILPLMITSYTV